MPFLTINGTEVPVQSSNAVRRQDYTGGQVRRSFNGSLLVSLKTHKREWSFMTRPLTSAEESNIRSVIGFGTYEAKTVDGSGIGGPVQCLVLIGEQPYIKDGLSHQVMLELSILEI